MLRKNDLTEMGIETILFPLINQDESGLDKKIKEESRLYRIKVYKYLLIIKMIVALMAMFLMKNMEHYDISWEFIISYLSIQSLNIFYFTKNEKTTYWFIFFLAIVDIVYICFIVVSYQNNMGFGLLILNLLLISSVLPFYPMMVFCLLSFLAGGLSFFLRASGTSLFDIHFIMEFIDYFSIFGDKLLLLFLFISLFGLAITIHWVADWSFKSEIKAKVRNFQLKRIISVNKVIIEQLKTGILIVDNNGLIVTLNSYASDLLGVKNNQEINTLFGLSKEMNRRFIQWSKTGEIDPEPYSHNIQSKELFVEFSKANSTIKGGGTIITLECSDDVKIKNRKATLAALGRLTAGIAHEIRNPLSSIHSAAQLMGEDESLNKQHKELLKMIGNNVNRTNHIIKDILGLFDNKKSNYRLNNLKNVLIQFSKDFISSNKDYQFKLEIMTNIDRKIYCMFDENQLNQAFWNLAYNALRYSGIEGTKVTFFYSIKENKVIVIDVYDNGNGIDEEKANKVFEPFYTSSNSGTGLGLYLTKEICSINHASIALLSKEESVSGAHFRITMPAYFTPNISPTQNS